MEIGAHIDQTDPPRDAAAMEADIAQFFLGDPQAWPKTVPIRADAAELQQSPIGLYVHAPYVINVATLNNRIRIPSRKMLDQQAAAATAIGAPRSATPTGARRSSAAGSGCPS